jgi:lipid-A-disaccharide synthase
MTTTPAILFTAFEPSGDDHAASVIRELRRRRPDLPIYAWGGPKMRRAGATIICETGHDAVVGVPGWQKIREHQLINKNIKQWLAEHTEVRLHVPVDSPAANFPIAKIARSLGRKVVHLVAPQLWAWGPWRLRKLRRCTDLVLCLLPFEEDWFKERGVPARFIGHPLFDEPLDLDDLSARAERLPHGSPKIAILPGSRPAELRRNFPVLLNAFKTLRERHPNAVGVVGATSEAVRNELYDRANALGGWPAGVDVAVGQTDLVTRWCDLAMVVSGTVTLQLAKQAKPMVIVYKTNELTFKLVGRWLITAPFFTLPNLIAGREIVPELIPYYKDEGQYAEAVDRLIRNPAALADQRKALQEVCARFDGKLASMEAADAIESMLGLQPTGGVSSNSRRTIS